MLTTGLDISKVLTFQPGYTMIGITSAKSAKRFQQPESANIWFQFPQKP